MFFFSIFLVYRNRQGFYIQWFTAKTGHSRVIINGFQFSKWTNSKSKVYWRCSKAQSLGFVYIFFNVTGSFEIFNVLLFLSDAKQEPAARQANIRAELRLFLLNIITVNCLKLQIYSFLQLTERFLE